MRGALVLVAALAGAGAHMSMVIPTPRNAIDGVNVPEMKLVFLHLIMPYIVTHYKFADAVTPPL